MANDTIYSSQQYQVLIELSAMLTSLIWDDAYKLCKNEIVTRIPRDKQALFVPQWASNTEQQTISIPGLTNIITTKSSDLPQIKLEYNNIDLPNTQLKNYLMSSYFNNILVNPSGYADYLNSFTSGILHELKISLNKTVIGIKTLIDILSDHHNCTSAHLNLDSLYNYYNKNEIDTKLNNLDLAKYKDDQKDRSELTDYFNAALSTHKEDINAHSKVNNLINYYNKTIIDSKFKQYLPIDNPIANGIFTLNNTNGNISISVQNNKFYTNGIITPDINISSKGTVQNVDGNNLKSLVNVEWYYNHLPARTTEKYTVETKVIEKQTPVTNNTYTTNTDNYYDFSMPDWANAIAFAAKQTQQDGKQCSKVYKVNVPGWIYFHTGHCSDCDMAVWTSYSPSFLGQTSGKPAVSPILNNPNSALKIGQCFGYGDRDQSMIMIPIFPGSQTYTLLLTDNSDGNIGAASWIFVPSLIVRKRKPNVANTKFFVDTGYYCSNSHLYVDSYPNGDVYQNTFNYGDNLNLWENNL